MEIKLYFQILRRTWWIIVITALAAVTASLAYSYFAQPVYRVSSRYLVLPNPSLVSGGSGMVLESLATLDRRSIIQTYAEIMNSPRIYKETLNTLNMDENALLDYTYSAVVLPDANIIELSVTGPNPETDVLLANSIGDHAIAFVKTIYQIFDIEVLDPAVPPIEPIRPQPLRDAVIALALGLGVGVALAFLNEALSTTIGNIMQRYSLDEMSSAFNRKTFERRLEALASSTAISDYLSLCLVEMAGLKDYLDVLPQPTLYQVLREAHTILRNQLRGSDIIGRWGACTFAVLLSETPGKVALNTMGLVRVALSVPIRINISGEELYLNPFIGIAEHEIGKSKDDLIKGAELALEQAKKGTDRVVLIDSAKKLLYREGDRLG